MSRMHRVYRATVTTLTPLHIGSGTRLLKDYDYVSHGGRTWVINSDELANQLGDPEDPGFQSLMRAKPVELIEAQDYVLDNPLWRYVLDGEARAGSSGSELQEMLKDPWDRPYIPGSSLKGAIRTALAYALWPEDKPVPYQEIMGRKVKQAAEPMENATLYGREARPHYDVMRAFHVADSSADAGRSMAVYNVQVVTGEKLQSPIELEAVRRDVVFETTITLDLDLLSRAGQLGWASSQVDALERFRTLVNGHSQDRILQLQAAKWVNAPLHLRKWYIDLYERIGKNEAEESGFITQLGWGGGWDSKTFGALLTADKAQFTRLVQTFDRFMDKQKSFKQGDLYPKSRRVVVSREGRPSWPFGWIEVKLEVQS